ESGVPSAICCTSRAGLQPNLTSSVASAIPPRSKVSQGDNLHSEHRVSGLPIHTGGEDGTGLRARAPETVRPGPEERVMRPALGMLLLSAVLSGCMSITADGDLILWRNPRARMALQPPVLLPPGPQQGSVASLDPNAVATAGGNSPWTAPGPQAAAL